MTAYPVAMSQSARHPFRLRAVIAAFAGLTGMAPVALAQMTPIPRAGQTQAPAPSMPVRPPSLKAQVRLLDAGRDANGVQRVGLEIVPPPGFKTYWRDAGESGIPPAFDWSASRNAGAVAVSYPVPQRFEDATGFSIGYHDAVVFPVAVTPQDRAMPVTLAGTVDFAICKDICVPQSDTVRLDLAATMGGPHAGAVAAAQARVPATAALGQPGDLAIGGVRWTTRGAVRGIEVAASVPDADRATELFPEAKGAVFGRPVPGAPSSPVQGGNGRPLAFFVPLARWEEAGAQDLTLTLVAGPRAIEVSTRLDAPPPSP